MAASFPAFALSIVLVLGGASGTSAAKNPVAPAQHYSLCGSDMAPGPLLEPPMVDVSALPLDALRRHELILSVIRDGPRFCYDYTWKGIEHRVPPTLLVHRGERFALRLVNEISGPAAGATMSASALAPCKPAPMEDLKPQAFSGYLNHTIYARSMRMKPTDVNMHFHGFEGPAEQENIFLSTLSTPAHACEYDITIPKTQPPGTYFYHPHAHGMAEAEIGGGLTGMWIVQPDTPQISPADEREIILRERAPRVLDDPFLTTARLAPTSIAAAAHERSLKVVPGLSEYDPFNPPPWPSPFPIRAGSLTWDPHGCGRFAAPLVSVDGVDAPARLTMPEGRPQLLRILNATADSAKYLRLRDATGKPQQLHIVGRDGVPVSDDVAHPLARYVPMDDLLLAPSGRIDILLTVQRGQTLTLYGDHRCLAPFEEVTLKHDLLVISAKPAAQTQSHRAAVSMPLQSGRSRASKLLRYARSHPGLVRRRALTFSEYIFPNASGKGLHIEFYITDTTNRDFHEHPYWPTFSPGADTPMQPDIVVNRGTIEEWYLINATLDEHSFHIHQMAFGTEDDPQHPWMLDTVMVPPGSAMQNPGDPNYALVAPSRTRILLDFRHVPRGEFVYHCHMVFHEDNGMMGIIRVE